MIPGIAPTITPLAGGTQLLEGYVTVGSYDGGVFYAYGYSSDDDPELPHPFGSVSGPASSNMIAFYWVPGLAGGVRFNTEALVGKYFHFMGISVPLTWSDDYSVTEADFTPAQVTGWPTSGTHPFYVELP